MKFSVTIPTRNSARTIARTLEAILRGSRQPDQLLVVDGCSTDDTPVIAKSLGVDVITNSRRHTAAARQAGVKYAQGDVVAFTDSDCIPCPDWLTKIASHFEADSVLSGVGGKVVLTQPQTKVQAFSARVFEATMQFPEEMVWVKETKRMRGSFPGANCSFRREAVISAGGFRDFFSNHAEEIDLFWRLAERGDRLLFDPAIVVEHLDYADTVRRLIKTNFNYGIASTKLAKVHMGRRVDPKFYRQLVASLWCYVNPFCQDEWAGLRCLQLAALIAGKLYSSIVFRTINI